MRRDRTSTVGHLVAAALAVLAGSATWALTTRTVAEAGTNAGLQARAAAISSTIGADDAALQVLGERYLAEHAAYAKATLQARTLRRAIARTAVAVTQDRAEVLDAAVSAYVNSGSDSGLSLFLDGNATTLASGQTYLKVASDQLGNAITRLRDAEHALATSLATERRIAAAASSALAATTADRSRVLQTVATEQHLLSSVRGQLAVLVHEEELARERAAALAEAAAARAAAARAAAAAAAAKSEASATTTTSGTAPATAAGPPAPSGVPSPSTSPIPAGTLSQDFAAIRNCESSGDYSLDTGNGYYGAYQFSLSTWEGLGGSGLPSAAAPALQDETAYRLYQGSGWSSWPECAAIIGL